MQTSIFLAQFFAIYFLIISIPLLFCTDSFRHRAKAYMKDDAAMLLGGIIALILGVVLILIHSIWVYDWRLLVTLLVWLTFIKGIVHVVCPKIAQHMMEQMSNLLAYRISGAICLLLAIFLGYHGFDIKI